MTIEYLNFYFFFLFLHAIKISGLHQAKNIRSSLLQAIFKQAITTFSDCTLFHRIPSKYVCIYANIHTYTYMCTLYICSGLPQGIPMFHNLYEKADNICIPRCSVRLFACNINSVTYQRSSSSCFII